MPSLIEEATMYFLTHPLIVRSEAMRYSIIALAALIASPMGHADEFTFDVVNDSEYRLIRLQASEDGRNWLDFDIGRGIDSGNTMTLVWDESTYGAGCHWSLRARFASNTWSTVARYDFCDPNLEITFSD